METKISQVYGFYGGVFLVNYILAYFQIVKYPLQISIITAGFALMLGVFAAKETNTNFGVALVSAIVLNGIFVIISKYVVGV